MLGPIRFLRLADTMGRPDGHGLDVQRARLLDQIQGESEKLVTFTVEAYAEHPVRALS
jgi:hypothetical protein